MAECGSKSDLKSIKTDAQVDLETAEGCDEGPQSDIPVTVSLPSLERKPDLEKEYLSYLGLMPDELQEDNVDVAIIHSYNDSNAAELFKEELVQNLQMRRPIVVKLNWEMGIGQDPKKLNDLILKKASIIFLFITRSYLADSCIDDSGYSCFLESIEKKEFNVEVVLTESELREELPVDLKHRRHVKYFLGFEKCRQRIEGLIRLNLSKLEMKNKDLDRERCRVFKDEIENHPNFQRSASMSSLPQNSQSSVASEKLETTSRRGNQKLIDSLTQTKSSPILTERENVQQEQTNINDGSAPSRIDSPCTGQTPQDSNPTSIDRGKEEIHHHYYTTNYNIHKAQNVAAGKNSTISFNTKASKLQNIASSSDDSESDSEEVDVKENSAMTSTLSPSGPRQTEENATDPTGLTHNQEPKQSAESSSDTKKFVGVFWDIENCSIPKGKCPLEIVRRIKEKYCDADKFKPYIFYVPCDKSSVLEENVQKALEKVVTLDNRSGDKKNICDVALATKMHTFAKNCGEGSRLILITCDGDFTEVLTDLQGTTKLEIILIHRERVDCSLQKIGVKTESYEELAKNLPDFNKPFKHSLKITGYPNNKKLLDKVTDMIKHMASDCGGELSFCKPKLSIIHFDSNEKAIEAKSKLEKKDFQLEDKKLDLTFTVMGKRNLQAQAEGHAAQAEGHAAQTEGHAAQAEGHAAQTEGHAAQVEGAAAQAD